MQCVVSGQSQFAPGSPQLQGIGGNGLLPHPSSPPNTLNVGSQMVGQLQQMVIQDRHGRIKPATLYSTGMKSKDHLTLINMVANQHSKTAMIQQYAFWNSGKMPGGSGMVTQVAGELYAGSPINSPVSANGNFPVSPAAFLQSQPGTPVLSPIKGPIPQITGPAATPQRPKSYEQKVVSGKLAQAQASTRPKSESDKEKVWKQKPERYKTELCRAFEDHAWCKYGSRCQFAHGMPELRQVEKHPKYKTQLCNAYHSTGYCKYGTRCHFIHNVDEGRVNMEQQNMSPNSQNQTPDEIQSPLPDTVKKAPHAHPQNLPADPASTVSPLLAPGHKITKTDLAPRPQAKSDPVEFSLLGKESLAAIWMPEDNNNVVFSFLPKNLLEI